MSWQRPPFNPQRAKLWSGGFSRVFGVVGDGVTHTYGLTASAAAYLVLFDGVVVPPEKYNVDAATGTVTFTDAPPAGGWIEMLGFGAGAAVPAAPISRWLEAGVAELRERLPVAAQAVSPRYTIDQVRKVVHSTNGAAIGPEGDVYLIPQDEYDILRVDTANRDVERIRVPGLDLYDYAKFAGGFTGPNGKIYGCPDKAAAVMEYDPVLRTGRMINIEPTYGDHIWTNDMISTGADVGGIVYGIPFDADYFMIVHGHGQTVRYDTFGLDLSPPGKWYGGVHYNGAFFAVPYNHTAILRIRPGGLIDLIPLTTAHPEYACKYRGGCVAGNIAYFAPFEADHVLEVNLDTFEMNERTWGLDLSGRFKYWGGGATHGKAVFVPFGAKEFLEVDIDADTARIVDYGLPDDIFDFDHAYAGAFADLHGRVHMLAYQANCGMVVDVQRGVSFVRKIYDRGGMYLNNGSDGVKFADGCQDAESRIYINPYNTGDVHWTLDTREYAVDRLDTRLFNNLGNEIVDKRDIVGARDFGDHYWWLYEDGDAIQFRMSGYTNVTPNLYGGNDFRHGPPPILDPGTLPTFAWGRTKAFFGLHSHAPTETVYALPSSQPYFAARDDHYASEQQTYPVTRLGWSRDQFYNGSVLGSDGNIYGIPYNGTHVLILNTVSEAITLTDFGFDMLGRRKWYGAVRAGDKIYCIPFDAPGVLVIDTSGAAPTAVITDFGFDMSGKRKFMSGARHGDNVIFVPCDHDKFFKYDTILDTAEMTDFGLPSDIMSPNFKWGACAVDFQGALVCGPLGTIGASAANLRNPAWITAAGGVGYSTVKFNGCGAGTFAIQMVAPTFRLAFRIKQSFGNNTATAYSPAVVPLDLPAGATNIGFLHFRTLSSWGWNTDCLYALDNHIYRMIDDYDSSGSIDPEDFSIFNEYRDPVPGSLRPWMGLPPAAWVKYDPDEEALPDSERRAYRKETGWNDPIFIQNNTSLAVHCNSGIAARCTVTQYNHFREYLRDANNFERCYWGAVEHDGKIYSVPHALPVLNILDTADNTVSLRRFTPPTGWDFMMLWKDGTAFGDYVVFFPYRHKWFGYYDTVNNTWEYPEIPANLYYDPADTIHQYTGIPSNLYTLVGWMAWVRRGDYVWGIPSNAEFFLKWDLAAKTATRVDAPPEDVDWSGKAWSDAMTFYKSESHPERDPVFLLPYNDDRLGVMYPWRRSSGPYLDLGHFHARFPGEKKWSCWAVPYAAVPPPVMMGVPCDAEGFLVCDVRGEEPYIDDFGLNIDWEVEGKWMSVVDLYLKNQGAPTSADARPISITVPYNAECILAIDHWTGKVYEVEYTGYSLVGERKWWGGAARFHGQTGVAYFAPYDAEGVLGLKLTVAVEGDALKVSAVGTLLTFGLSMTGAGKWRGAEVLGNRVVMIPYNHNRFLQLTPTPSSTSDSSVNLSSTTGLFTQLGIPDEWLTGHSAKWAPNHTTAKPEPDENGGKGMSATLEFEYPAETHPYTLRVAYASGSPQAWLVPYRRERDHQQDPPGERGWIPVRHRLPYTPLYPVKGGVTPLGDVATTMAASWMIPWTTDTFLAVNGSRVDIFNAGWRMHRPRKFSAAALDRDGRIVCLPAGGYQALVFDPDAGTMEWIQHSNLLDKAPGYFSEFAYVAPGGKIFGAVRSCFRNKYYNDEMSPLTDPQRWTLDWRAERPVHFMGDAFTFDYAMEFQDTESYWPRWYSYNSASSSIRWEDVCAEEAVDPSKCGAAPAVPVTVETRRHGCMYASELGMGLMPGNTGSMIVYKRSNGRAGYSRVQASLITENSGGIPKTTRNPATYAVALGRPGYVWLLPTVTYITPEIATGSSDPLYLHEVELSTGNVLHHRLESPWYARLAENSIQLSVVAVGGYAWLFPRNAVTNADGTPLAAPVLRVNLDVFDQTMVACPGHGVQGNRWHPRVFTVTGAPTALPYDFKGPLLVFAANGASFAPRAQADPLGAAALRQLGNNYDPALLAFDGEYVYSVVATYSASPSDRAAGLQTLTAAVRGYSLIDDSEISYNPTLKIPLDAPYGVIWACVYRDGKLYCAFAPKPGVYALDSRIYVNLIYLEVDLDGFKLRVGSAYGASTMRTVGGFVAGDGGVWYEMYGNARLIRYFRLDPDNEVSDEPVRQGRHVGSQVDRQFNPCQAAEGTRLYLAPTLIRSRSSVLYVLDTAEPSLRSYGYGMACKDTHKWNGWVYDDNRYAYGMPFNNDTILRLDFADPDNPVADQVMVDDYAYVETYAGGNTLDFVYHKSNPAEGYARGGTVSKYGVVWSNPYAPRDGQTLEIKPNGRSRVRVPGPDYAYPRKWADLAAGADGKLYGAPFDSPEVFFLDPENGRAGSGYANMHEGLDGWEKYAIVAPGPSKVYMLPYSAEDVLVVDPAAERLDKLLPAGIDLSGKRKWRGSAKVGDVVYCAPYDAHTILKFNTATEEAELLPVPGAEGTAKWRCFVRGGDGRLYAAPFDAPDLLSLDPATGDVDRFGVDMDFAGARKWAVAALGRDGKTIMAAGGTNGAFLELTLNSNGSITGRLIEGSGSGGQTDDRYGLLLQQTTTIESETVDAWFAAPAAAAAPARVYGDEVAYGTMPSNDPAPGIVDRWLGGYQHLLNGNENGIVLVPYNHTMVGRLDSDNKLTLSAVARRIEGTKKWSDVLVRGDKAYYLPWNHDLWMVMDTDYLMIEETDFGTEMPEGTERWSAMWRSGDRVYAVPYSCALGATLNVAAGTVKYSTYGLPEEEFAGDGKWSDCIEMLGRAFCIPHNAEKILMIPSTGKGFLLEPGIVFKGAESFCGGAAFNGGYVWANQRYDFTCLVKQNVDEDTGQFTLKAKPGCYGVTMAQTNANWRFGGAHAVNEYQTLLLPGGRGGANARTALLLDCADGVSYASFNLPYSVYSATLAQSVAATSRGDYVYLWAFGSRDIIRYDPAAKTFTRLSGASLPAMEPNYTGGYLDADGNLLGVPFGADRQCRVAPNDAVSLVVMSDIAEDVDLSLPEKWWGCATVEGRTWFVPYSIDKVVVVEADGSMSVTDYGLDLTGEAKWRGAVVRGKYVIFVPYNAPEWLVIDTEADTAELRPDPALLLGGRAHGGFTDDGETVILLPGSAEDVVRVTIKVVSEPEAEPELVIVNRGAMRPLVDWSDREKFSCGFLDADDYLVMVPARAQYFMKFDLSTNLVWTERYGADLSAATLKYSGAARASTGYVYLSGSAQTYPAYIRPDTSVLGNLFSNYDTVGVVAFGEYAYFLRASGTYRKYRLTTYYGVYTLTGVSGYTMQVDDYRRLRLFNGKLYSALFNSNYLFMNNLDTTLAFHTANAGLSVQGKWRGCIPNPDGSGGYALPYNESRIFYHDGVSAWVWDVEGVPEGEHRWLGGCWYDGKLYGCPYDAESIAVYDPVANTFDTVDYGADLTGVEKWSYAFVRGEEIYFMPARADHVLIVNPALRTHRTVPCPTIVAGAEDTMWPAWVAVGDKVYGIPYDALDLIEFDANLERFIVRRVGINFKGRERWACGCASSDGNTIIFPPYLAEQSLQFNVGNRRGRLTWSDSRDRLTVMRPIAGVARWWNNEELIPDSFDPNTDLNENEDETGDEEPVEEEPPEEPEEDPNRNYAWVAISALSGAARYDRDTGAIISTVANWATNEELPTDQFHGFAYSDRSGKVYGVPYNARGTLVVSLAVGADGVTIGGASASVERLCVDMAVNNERHTAQPSGGIQIWRVYADNYVGGVRDMRLEQTLAGGSARKVLRIDPFTGILYPHELDKNLEWMRPDDVFRSSSVITANECKLWANKYGVFGAATLGPDGLLYFMPNESRWGLVMGPNGVFDRIYTPLKGVMELENSNWTLKWHTEPMSASALDRHGNIVWAPGTDVTAGKINKTGGAFATKTWFDIGDPMTDSRGYLSRRTVYHVPFVETGVKASTDAMYAIARLLNSG